MGATGLQPLTIKEINEVYVKELRGLANDLHAVAAAIKAAGLEEIEVMNRPGADFGMANVRRLINSCQNALTKHAEQKAKERRLALVDQQKKPDTESRIKKNASR